MTSKVSPKKPPKRSLQVRGEITELYFYQTLSIYASSALHVIIKCFSKILKLYVASCQWGRYKVFFNKVLNFSLYSH